MPATDEPDDRTLLQEFCATRSESAFTALVSRHLPLVFHAALRRLGSAALAEEAAQFAFSRLAAKVSTVARHPERLRAWLSRTAYFEACKLARREGRLSRLPILPEPEPMTRPEIYDRLDDALNRLPELDRELVIRHCCDGEEYRDVASAVGKSAAACQKRVERALALLGRNLGGAKTAGVALAAFAASSAKSSALPSAERIAAVALKQHATIGVTTGALSGMKIAACAVLVLAGGAAGWQQQATQPPPPERVRSAAATHRAMAQTVSANSGNQNIARAPNRATGSGSLDDVLESIQTGHFKPLIDFLPKATVADLRAILAEDDLSGLGEGSGSFRPTREIALRRWTELDPAGAFKYGVSRDRECTGYRRVTTAVVITDWLRADATAALNAYGVLPAEERLMLVDTVMVNDPDTAVRLMANDPVVRRETEWKIEEQRQLAANPPDPRRDAERTLEELFSGKWQEEPGYRDSTRIANAFQQLSGKDNAALVARAKTIPWPFLRTRVLSDLYRQTSPAPTDLPPGELRQRCQSAAAVSGISPDPDQAVALLRALPPGKQRDRVLVTLVSRSGVTDPWRVMEQIAAMDGGFNDTSAIEKLILQGAKDDPRRALAMVHDLAGKLPAGDGFQSNTRILVGKALGCWADRDMAAAIRWAAAADLSIPWQETRKLILPPQQIPAIREMLINGSPAERQMADTVITTQLAAAVKNGTAASLLTTLPRDQADEMLASVAGEVSNRGQFDEALRIGAMASPEGRRETVLPEVAFAALLHDPAAAVPWLQALPPDDLQAATSGVERKLREAAAPRDPSSVDRFKPVINALQQLKP